MTALTSPDDPLRQRIRQMLAADETQSARALLGAVAMDPAARGRIQFKARQLVDSVRARKARLGDLDTFLAEYSLSSQEGVVLMCLAEALLRIPDAATADALIREKIGEADWARHLGHSNIALVNASTWALMLSGRVVSADQALDQAGLAGVIRRLVGRIGEPMVREALGHAMRLMGRHFVLGETIKEALSRADAGRKRGYRHSFDMLGEGARTSADAKCHFDAYADAINAIGIASAGAGPVAGPGLSVKLSAIHPRFEFAQRERVLAELTPRLTELCLLAKEAGIGLTVDAEEVDRLEPSLDILAQVATDPALAGWDGLGLAVQSYQKRAVALMDWLVDLAGRSSRRLMVRLVKGAYWDGEIKRAQERGLDAYPVFTRKAATDVSYLACAKRMLAEPARIFSQFATHNAHTVAAVIELAGAQRDWEFQRLHGMGEPLHDLLLAEGWQSRIYAPVGIHRDLLPYLVRRLLENGANTSFVNALSNDALSVHQVVSDPVADLNSHGCAPHPRIPLPADLYGSERRNSSGMDLADPRMVAALGSELEAASTKEYQATPLVGGKEILTGMSLDVLDPADLRRRVGTMVEAGPEDIARAARLATRAQSGWDRQGGEGRALILEKAASLFEKAAPELIWLAVREAGKTLPDSVGEVREAVDFLRYYAAQAREKFEGPLRLLGVAGETNMLSLHGRGVFACISPWNFPLAIFTGQVAAALAAGNAVLAKPAEQTPLMAAAAVRLMLEAGVPPEILHLLPGDGRVGQALLAQPAIGGVAFTGSVETARLINRQLAAKDGPIAALIAETGGLNAMIVDSSALPEQVVGDVLASAFNSAGQRCSALRMLFLQDEIHDQVVEMLAGAAKELVIGDPMRLSTDIGPVIDLDARKALAAHAERMREKAEVVFEASLPKECDFGTFFAPRILALGEAGLVKNEVFGPVLHVVRYRAETLDRVLDQIASSGFGLTLGVHSRIAAFARQVVQRLGVGNIYINRNMIGAVVGAQPFGGEGLSGTGPKAGGPQTLPRFAVERTVTTNVAATGGNIDLLSLSEEPVARLPSSREG